MTLTITSRAEPEEPLPETAQTFLRRRARQATRMNLVFSGNYFENAALRYIEFCFCCARFDSHFFSPLTFSGGRPVEINPGLFHQRNHHNHGNTGTGNDEESIRNGLRIRLLPDLGVERRQGPPLGLFQA